MLGVCNRRVARGNTWTAQPYAVTCSPQGNNGAPRSAASCTRAYNSTGADASFRRVWQWQHCLLASAIGQCKEWQVGLLIWIYHIQYTDYAYQEDTL